ncbi:uncharacterized protein LOC109841758 [Asparagus officinalis]|uniref:uncharacterized protein LOC109841758 n=1 Tax=Asparagus officinalis TaxID=4686 RepID=UPI00098E0AF1|nr:uncharacterized protein LOC109841758 [Asparagus officinalis]
MGGESCQRAVAEIQNRIKAPPFIIELFAARRRTSPRRPLRFKRQVFKKYEQQLYRDYKIVLLLLALVAVPWMLFPKPFILRRLHKEISRSYLWHAGHIRDGSGCRT